MKVTDESEFVCRGDISPANAQVVQQWSRLAPLIAERSDVAIVGGRSCRSLVRGCLEALSRHVTVHEFERPSTALEWISANAVSLIVIDFSMSKVDGIALVKKLRALPHVGCAAIVVAAIDEDRTKKIRALNAGVTYFLSEPIDRTECRVVCGNLLALSQKPLVPCASGEDTTSFSSSARAPETHVAIKYDELFALTSAIAAIETMLLPARQTITALESAVGMPLQGDSEIEETASVGSLVSRS